MLVKGREEFQNRFVRARRALAAPEAHALFLVHQRACAMSKVRCCQALVHRQGHLAALALILIGGSNSSRLLVQESERGADWPPLASVQGTLQERFGRGHDEHCHVGLHRLPSGVGLSANRSIFTLAVDRWKKLKNKNILTGTAVLTY